MAGTTSSGPTKTECENMSMTSIYDVLTDTPRVEAVEGMAFSEYRQTVGMNPSSIWAGRRDMEKMFDEFHSEWPDKPAFIVGRAVHANCLEPVLFKETYLEYEGKSRINKGFKDMVRDNPDCEVLTTPEWNTISAMADKVRHDPVAAPYIAKGSAEVSVFVGEFNMQCRGRIDWVSVSENAIIDIKTTRNIDPEAFGRDFRKFGYHMKLALYRRWFEKITGKRLPVFIIAVENERPYEVTVIPIPDAVLDQGEKIGLRILNNINIAIITRRWPGISNGELVPLHVPAWEMEDDEPELTLGGEGFSL